jgi:hypothetical protein
MSRIIAFALASLCAVVAHAQGGPPFRTDDPDTPGNQHWEINFGWVGDRNPSGGAYQVPDFDINYGLGDRIQLKYELPIAIEEIRPLPAAPGQPAQSGHVIAGLGESLLGVKFRFFEHQPHTNWVKDTFGTGLHGVFGHQPAQATAPSQTPSPSQTPDQTQDQDLTCPDDSPHSPGEKSPEPNFSLSTYPQLFLDNPTRAVARGLVAPGPSFFLPLEVSGRMGPIRFDIETGYNFGNYSIPRTWNSGLLVGHEFKRNEVYVEIYDTQDVNFIPAGHGGVGEFATGYPRQRESTLGLGGRHALNKSKTLNLLEMGGRSFQSITATNGQPSWIAYVGIQVLFGPKNE